MKTKKGIKQESSGEVEVEVSFDVGADAVDTPELPTNLWDDTAEVFRAARHEAGHGIAAWHLWPRRGERPFDWLFIDPDRRDTDGRIQGRSAVHIDALDDEQVERTAIVTAGLFAEVPEWTDEGWIAAWAPDAEPDARYYDDLLRLPETLSQATLREALQVLVDIPTFRSDVEAVAARLVEVHRVTFEEVAALLRWAL